MFFVKITTITNIDYIINLDRITLISRTHHRIEGSDVEVCTITYDMGGGSVTSFTVRCILDQFHDFLEYCLSCITSKPPTLTDYLTQENQSCNGNGKAQSTEE
jgi:hypothetical protein